MTAPTIKDGKTAFFMHRYEGNGGGQKVGKFVPVTDSGTVAKSCLFNEADNAYLHRTPSGAGNKRTWTWSGWLKFTNSSTSGYHNIWTSRNGSTSYFEIAREVNQSGNYRIDVINKISGSTGLRLITNRSFKDNSTWNHFVFVADTTNATASNRFIIYVNGEKVTSYSTETYPTQNYDTYVNATDKHEIGAFNGGAGYMMDGYMAEVNFVDGTALTPSSFGVTDTSTGRWIPKSLSGITYGTNGFRMEFANTAGQTIGDDTSGNGNDYTVVNLTASDITIDSPSNNFPIFTKNDMTGSENLTEGSLKPTFASGTGASAIPTTFEIPVGKWYFEYYIPGTNSVLIQWAVAKEDTSFSDRLFRLGGFKTYQPYTRAFYISDSAKVDATDMALAEDDTTVGFYIERTVNGGVKYWVGDDAASKGTFSFQSSMNPATGANAVEYQFLPEDKLRLYTGSDGNGSYSGGVRGVFNFGQLRVSPVDSGTNLTDYTSDTGGFFRFEPTSGFKALCQDNVPSNTRGIPGLSVIKNFDAGDSWQIYDSSRGPTKELHWDADTEETTTNDGLQEFIKGGMVIEKDDTINTASETFMAYNWVGNSGTTETNDASSTGIGTIDSTYQVNSTAGFSIVQYTGTGSAGTVKHGLSTAPDWMIVKGVSNSDGWVVSHRGLTSQATYSLALNNFNAESSSGGTNYWNSTAPTSSVFSIATDTAVNGSSRTYVAYCWHEVKGYSKFGTYEGTGNEQFIYTGFTPRWILIRKASVGTFGSGDSDWYVYDSLLNPENITGNASGLRPNNAAANLATLNKQILSNGFMVQSVSNSENAAGGKYIYCAFAERPYMGTHERSPAIAQ